MLQLLEAAFKEYEEKYGKKAHMEAVAMEEAGASEAVASEFDLTAEDDICDIPDQLTMDDHAMPAISTQTDLLQVI